MSAVAVESMEKWARDFKESEQKLATQRLVMQAIDLSGWCRAGLAIEQTGQMLGALRFWGPRAWMSKHTFTGFSYFSAVHHASKL